MCELPNMIQIRAAISRGSDNYTTVFYAILHDNEP